MIVIIAIGVALLSLLVLVRYLENTGVFFPVTAIENTPNQLGLDYEDVYFKTFDGVKLNGWLIKTPGAVSTLIFAHGNAGNMSHRLPKARFFSHLGLNVFLFDYRGYGRSEGKPSEQGIYLDGQAAYDYLNSRGNIKMDKIIFYGASLGGVVAVDVSLHRPITVLMVDSSITSAKEIAKRVYPMIPSWLLSLKFDSISKVERLRMPKIFIHSPEDRVVPYTMGRQLFEAAKEPKEFLQSSGGHNDGGITIDPKAAEHLVVYLKKNNLI